jgi:hypothetical protein
MSAVAVLLADEPSIAMVTLLQNLCDDRSIVDVIHPALTMSSSDREGGRVDCEGSLLETVQGAAAFHVSATSSLMPVWAVCLSHALE